MIEVSDLEIPLNDTKYLKAESFTIESGLWALVGRNGSGKSSFLNTILQSKKILGGSIFLNGKSISDWQLPELAKIISVVYTKPSIFGSYTVKEVVELGRLPYADAFGTLKKQDYEFCNRVIDTLKITEFKNARFSILSDGEKQLVMIARAMAQDTPIIILDEPTAFLDIVNRNEIIKLLKEVSVKQDKIILFSTHDVDLIPDLCDGLLWIENGILKSSNNKREFDGIIENLFLV